MDSGSIKYIPEPPQELLLPSPRPPFISRKNAVLVGVAVIVIVFSLYRAFLAAPTGMEKNSVFSIQKGETLSGVADRLSTLMAVRSRFAFKSLVVLFGGSKGIQAGDYYFPAAENAIRVAWRLTHSGYQLVNVRVTIPEGSNSGEIADILGAQKNLTHFDKKEFTKLAAPYEGYLFPDTYLLLPNVTAQNVVDILLANYQKRIETLSADIQAFGRPMKDVIRMASIIEEEARTEETRETIAGILWKRLDQGMPLQVDSAFAFVNGKKDSRYISTADLAIDSPFNTYIHKGLPPTAISNPGLDSIKATVHPIATKYYFYLSDDQGNMHYAVTLDQHVANKEKYLNF